MLFEISLNFQKIYIKYKIFRQQTRIIRQKILIFGIIFHFIFGLFFIAFFCILTFSAIMFQQQRQDHREGDRDRNYGP